MTILMLKRALASSGQTWIDTADERVFDQLGLGQVFADGVPLLSFEESDRGLVVKFVNHEMRVLGDGAARSWRLPAPRGYILPTPPPPRKRVVIDDLSEDEAEHVTATLNGLRNIILGNNLTVEDVA